MEQAVLNEKMMSMLENLDNRMEHMETKLDDAVARYDAALLRLELSNARMEGALGILKFTIPIVVAIGGVTVGALALFK